MDRAIPEVVFSISFLRYTLRKLLCKISRGKSRTLIFAFIMFIVSFFPLSAQVSEITIGNSSYAGMASQATANSLTWPHTIASSSNGILIVTISVRTDVPVSFVTYGGYSLTLAGFLVDDTDKVRSEMWYMKAPTAGTVNIIVTLVGSANFVAGATNFFGIDQTTPYSVVVTGKGTGDPSLTVASAAGELVIDGISDRDVDSESFGSGQSILWTNKNGTTSEDAWGGSTIKAGAASVNMNWTTTGGGAGEWAGIAISLKPFPNTAPLLDNSGTITLTTITEDQTTNAGNTIAAIIASAGGDRITDPDAGAVEGIAVTTLVIGNGIWQYSINGGTSWTAVGLVSDLSALLLRSTDLIRFVPDAMNADMASFNFRSWDQTNGSAGTKVDASVNGGTTAFSTATESASITVTAVNDAPGLAVGVALPAINEDDYNNSGFLVSGIANYSTDVDAGAVKGLAIPGVDNSNGTWQYTLNGTTWLPMGNVTTSGARLLPSNVTARVRFVPNANWYGNTGMFNYLAWDQTTGSAGDLADVTVRGGITAFGSGISGTVQTVNSVNDAPVITSNGGGATASINVMENTTAVTTVIANDVDVPAQTLTYSISGSADAAKFAISSSTGALSFISAPDFENPADADLNNIYTVTVQVSDGNLTDTQALSVTVTNVSNSLIVTSVSDVADGTVTSIEALNVNKGADGVISLREAIIAANNTAGTDEISFNIPGTGTHTINVQSALPLITGTVILDGTTEPDFNGTPIIELNGASAGVVTGLVLSADNSTIRGFVINRFGSAGIVINGDNNKIAGNFIGTDVTGTFDLGNANTGISISAAASGNQIGGVNLGEGNVISGNSQDGIQINGASNTVAGNIIGLNASGSADLGNGRYGIRVAALAGNTIGGMTGTYRNVISGNDVLGILLAGSTGTMIQGNYIGTSINGSVDLGNTSAGLMLDSNATGNTIGGLASGAGNVISGNNSYGIYVVAGSNNNTIQGNIIGLTASGTVVLGNSSYGIQVSSANNTLGGTTVTTRNVISANNGGISLSGINATGNVVQGNYIGSDITGSIDLGNMNDGVQINSGATNNMIGGTTAYSGNLISGNNSDGIEIVGGTSTGNLIQGNYIGTDVTGTQDLGNSVAGVRPDGNNNTIGGTTADARNIISGNSSGITIGSGTGNIIQGNYIGTNASATSKIGNTFGVWITGGTANVIGGTTAEAANVISGNSQNGVYITGTNTNQNVIQGNYIGTNAGSQDLGNGSAGILLSSGAANNKLGGTQEGAENTIAFNSGDGIWLNTDAGSANAILGNSIYSNGGIGLDLLNDNVTANDAGDGDTGPNNLQNFPVLTSALTNKVNQIIFTGTLNSTANSQFRIEFFANTAQDATGYGEGQSHLGSAGVTTDGSGNVAINVVLSGVSVPAGSFVTATATVDLGSGNFGSTSEFASDIRAVSSLKAPGGVFTGLIQWLRADAGTTIATGVSEWSDQSSAERNATQGNGVNQPLFSQNSVNFNPALGFNGTTQYMQFSDVGMVTGANTRSTYAIATTGIADGTHRYLTQYGTGASGQSYALLNNGNEEQTAGWVVNHTVPGGVWATINIPRMVYGDYTGTLARGSFNGNAITSTAYTWNTILNTNGYVGTRTGITEYWNGKIAEIIQYNAILSVEDINKVHSYLAIKYGITLDQTAAQNYTASNGSTVYWNGATNSGYKNNLAGIARDDNSALTQKQSKSVNPGLQVVIGNGNTIADDNASNSSAFSADKSALVWGDNAGSVSEWTATGAPTGRKIIPRTWKVQETGTVGSVKVQVPDNSGTNGLPVEDNMVYLLVDADGNFASGASEITMTLDGTNWEAHVDLTTGQFFTFATEALVGTPVFTLGATSTRCQGAGTVTCTATATNTTGITYTLDAASITGGNSIVSGTGAVTFIGGWYGTSIITASAAGVGGPKTAIHTVTITPTAGTPVFTLGATSNRCQGAGAATYTATATNTTGITYTLDEASLTGGNIIDAGTGTVTYVEGWSGTSIITAIAAGCDSKTSDLIVNTEDVTGPVITCPGERTEYLSINCEFIIPDYLNSVSVLDNCDPAPSVTQSPVAGTIISGEGTIQPVTIFSSDKSGNTASCTFNILLHDTTPPLITCLHDTIITLGEGLYKTEVILAPPAADDNCGIQSVTNDFNGGANASGIYHFGTTVVTYTAIDLNGNSTKCSQQITLTTGGDLPYGLVIPQGFSPNNDGLNDKFEILGLEAYPENELSVFNIWGYEIFYMQGYNNSWDGTASKGISSGKKLPTGTYYYILKLGNEQSVKGFVYIIKE